jgi:syntaxin-binding protein 1
MHLARFVQEELDEYAQWNPDFPPASSRPQGVLVITDRSMDLMAPLIHEFTYQAMAHDLLDIKEGDKVTYHMTINEGTREAEEKDMELQEKDKVWVDNRHRHMKDTIDKLMGDFQKFMKDHGNFADEGKTTNLNAIKDMLAGLPQFQEGKEAYSLHLTMAQECMNAFQHRKLPDVASTEQTLATGLDEDYRKPKNILDQVVRLLDDDAIVNTDRLRLIMMYIIFRDGVILEDVKRLLAHSNLPPQDGQTISNLELLGARITHGLKEVRQPPPPLFPIDTKGRVFSEEYALSRFETAVKQLLDHLCKGTLDPTVFPYVKPPLDPNEDMMAGQGSLRAAKPSWAGAGRRVVENRQRILIYMAGGATYSESRACYEASTRHGRDVFLVSSHMLTPGFFVRQLQDLSQDKRRLDIPMERPTRKAPAHIFEKAAPPPMQQQPPPMAAPPQSSQTSSRMGQPMGGGVRPSRGNPRPPPTGGIAGIPSDVRPPTKQLGQMTLSSGGRAPMNGGGRGGDASHDSPPSSSGAGDGKLHKGDRDKKKRNLFGLKK